MAGTAWRAGGVSANVVGLMTAVVDGINQRAIRMRSAPERLIMPTSLQTFVRRILPSLL
jgi:hypothetical protein